MKKQVFAAAIALGLAGGFAAQAVPAKRGIREIVQPDGTVVKAEQRGDERFHYFMSENGVPMVRDTDGMMQYVALNKSGELEFTRVTKENNGARKAPAKDAGNYGTEEVLEALYKHNSAQRANTASLPQSGMGRMTGDFPRTGDIPALVFLVEYQDVKFTHPDPAQYFGDMVNKEGFNEYGGTGSATDYFLKQSGGQFRPQFDVFGPVTLPNKRSYYGGNSGGGDKAAEDMLVHAAKLLDDQVDFSKYDLDNDGKVDNVFIFYAGQGEASYGPVESVWPHQWELSVVGKAFKLDGKTIDRYACTNEWEQNRPDGVGTFIHEFSHVMGLPDLYHTVNSYAEYTPDTYCVMDYGPYNNNGCTPPNYSAYERNAMGWIEPQLLNGPASVTLKEIGENNECCLIQTEKSTEFFLLENRQQTGWDKYIPGHGMLIWHIDYVTSVFDRNVVNNMKSHQYVDIVEAGGVANSTTTSTLASYPWPGTRNKTSFTSTTSPALKSWAGKGIDVPITEIAENNGVISFNVCGGKIDLEMPEGVKAKGNDDGSADLSWDAVQNAVGYKLNLYTKDASGEPAVYALEDYYTTGTSNKAEHLKSETTYYLTVTACAGQNESEPSDETSFVMPALAWEFLSPQTLPTEDYDESGFTACWESLEGAVAYILNVEAETDGGESTELTEFGSNDTMTLPQGWNWTGTSTYTSNSQGFFGNSAPSLKFTASNQNLTTDINPYEITNVEWWQRGANASAQNKVTLEGRSDATDTWSTIYFCNPSPNSGETITVKNMPSNIHQLRFVFSKVMGNLAFDDLKITVKSLGTEPLEGYENKNVGNTESHKVVFGDLKPNACYFTVKAVDADGKESTVSDRRRVSRMDNTGISSPANGATGLSISGLTITYTASAGEMLRVFNMAGMLVASAKTNAAGMATVELPAGGLYIVSTASGATKVSLR